MFLIPLSEYLKKIGGHCACLTEKENLFRYQGKSLAFCMCTSSCVCTNDAKIVRSRDAQYNIKELP